MGDILDAFHAHSQLDVLGVHIYDLDELPGPNEVTEKLAKRTIQGVMFPIFNELSGSFEVPTSTAGHGDETVEVNFLCVHKKATEGYGVKKLAPAVVQLYQDYRLALIRNPDLRVDEDDYGLAQDVTMSVQFVVVEWPGESGINWIGFQVQHTWEFLFDDK